MTRDDYKATLEKAKDELEELLIKQEEIEQRIARVKQAIISLAPLAQDQENAVGDIYSALFDGIGLSEAILQVLRAAGKRLSPVEIKQQILNMGVDLSTHKNAMASIHSALKRMGQNEEVSTKDNGLTYEVKRRSGHASRGRLSDLK
jgi:hypothetical protein